MLGVQVPQHTSASLYVDGKVHEVLQPGLHAFWNFNRDLRVEMVDLRLQALEVAGQEILTKDKVALRVNLNAGVPRHRRAGRVRAAGEAGRTTCTSELQFGLRAAVGTRTLDELLENKG